MKSKPPDRMRVALRPSPAVDYPDLRATAVVGGGARKHAHPASSRRMRWTQDHPSRRSYELIRGRESVARLRWTGFHGAMAEGEFFLARWTLQCVGSLSPLVRVRVAGAQRDAAIFRPKTGGEGLLLCAGCGLYAWRACDIRASEWAFFGSDGSRVVSFRFESPRHWNHVMKVEGVMEVAPWAESLPAHPLLVLTGWYLVVLQHHDASLLAAATSEASAG